MALIRRDRAAARVRLAGGIELATRQGAPVIEVLYVEGAAAYLGLLGRHEQAYRLLAGAEAWRHRLKVPVAPVNVERQGRLGRMLENRLDAYTRASLEKRARRPRGTHRPGARGARPERRLGREGRPQSRLPRRSTGSRAGT